MNSERLEQTKMLAELSKAKQAQEDLLQKLSIGITSASNEETKRVSQAIESVARAQGSLRSASDEISGTAQKFATQIEEAMRLMEQKLIEIVQGQLQMLARITGPVKWGLLIVALLLCLDIMLRFR